jgi:hypothetical protein
LPSSNHQSSVFVKHRDELSYNRSEKTIKKEVRCQCGHGKDEHDSEETDNNQDWNMDDHTVTKSLTKEDVGPEFLTDHGPRVSLR